LANIIFVSHLKKEFRVTQKTRNPLRNFFAPPQKTVSAVDDISFNIAPGELVGYLGPNGAGKSTTIKMLTGILVPTSGEISVSGREPHKQRREHVAHIGAVFGQRNTLWWDLPVGDSFDLLRDIYRIPPDRYAQNMVQFRALLGLDEFMRSPVRALSLGQLMRANLAAALVHDPDVLFLDEPTIGLDVVAKERIREFIANINARRGVTVILTTHDLQDVEKLCNRVMMIDHGKLLFDGALDDLLRRFGGERELEVDFAEPVADAAVPGARLIKQEGLRAVYRFSRETMSASDLIGALSARFRIADLSVREPQIEDTIRRIYEEQLLAN
jgi:ABC-2 type transport system ATP-binding protein